MRRLLIFLVTLHVLELLAFHLLVVCLNVGHNKHLVDLLGGFCPHLFTSFS
jgi:hypothetical protein